MKKFIHIDMDCFYAAVEMRDNPALANVPLAIGGNSRRGVLSTANYIARKYGVRSAMSNYHAKQLCPDLVIVPGRMQVYKEISTQIRAIFAKYTDLIEPLSLDEAFIDVTGSDQCQGSATLMAKEIRQRVFAAVGITVSAGVAPNKFLAKIGSDWNKPDGLCVIIPEQVDEFVRQLPVGRLSGVGRVTAEKLHRIGVQTCGDLRRFDAFELADRFGSFGPRLHQLSYGVDDRPVHLSRHRKSLSVEHTYASDLFSVSGCINQLPQLFNKLTERLTKLGGDYRVRKQFVKVKFSNFQSTTMECVAKGVPRMAVFNDLCQQSCLRGNGLPVRLLGLGVRFQDLTDGGKQLSLFTD